MPSASPSHARRLAVLLALTFAFVVGAASLPGSGGGPIAQLAPQSAAAATTGFGRGYLWIKITRSEVTRGLAGPVCVSLLAPTVVGIAACPFVAWVAGRSVGAGGLWVNIYGNGQIRYGGY